MKKKTKVTAKQAKRNRKIISFIGTVLVTAGVVCEFIFMNTREEYELPVLLAVVGMAMLLVGGTLLNIVGQVTKSKRS